MEKMGYILPIHLYSYEQYQTRLIQERLDYAKYYPVSRLYNEKQPYYEKYSYGKERKETPKSVKEFTGKGLHMDVYV